MFEHTPTIRTGTLLFCPSVDTLRVKGMSTVEFCSLISHIFITNRAFHCYDQSIIIPDFLFIWFGLREDDSHVSPYRTTQSGNFKRNPSIKSSFVGIYWSSFHPVFLSLLISIKHCVLPRCASMTTARHVRSIKSVMARIFVSVRFFSYALSRNSRENVCLNSILTVRGSLWV